MSRIFQFAILVALLYVGFVLWQNHKQSAAPETVATQPVPAAPTANTAPSSTPVPIELGVSRHNLAPNGTLFLIQRVSVMTDSGVAGKPPGTRVTLITTGPPMRVTDGHDEFDVTASQVTNDLDVATRYYNADQTARAALSAVSARQSQELAQQENAAALTTGTTKQQTLPASSPQPTAADVTSLNQAPTLNIPTSTSASAMNGRGKGKIH